MKVGLVLPTSDYGSYQPRYSEIKSLAIQAEEQGFDALWLFDHLMFQNADEPAGGMWECGTMLAALAEATQHIELGSFVLSTAFRPPIVVAKMAATLDEISQRRFVLGLGAGWHYPEFQAFGFPYDHRVARFEEALCIITTLLRTGEVDFCGQYYRASQAKLLPRGPSKMGPPILIGAFQPRMLQLTARYADLWNVCWLGKSERLLARLPALHNACLQENRDPASLSITVGCNVSFQSADELCLPPDAQAMALSGSVEQVAEELHRFAQIDVAQLICNLNPLTTTSLSRFAEAVALYRAYVP